MNYKTKSKNMTTISDMLKKVQALKNDIDVNIINATLTMIPDEEGMIDRKCPRNECGNYFKVNFDEVSKSTNQFLYCPICGSESDFSNFLPEEQRYQLVNRVRGAIANNWKYGVPFPDKLITIFSNENFIKTLKCDSCDFHFSVIGTAFYCPSCGKSLLENKENVDGLIDSIESTINQIDNIRITLEATFSKDEVADIVNNVIVHSLCQSVGILQSYSEFVFNRESHKIAPFNAFINLEKSDKLWLELFGKSFKDWLDEIELSNLKIFVQQRHVLEHKMGIVDMKYLQSSGDTTYKCGERIVVNSYSVLTLCKIIRKIIGEIDILKE